LEFIACIPQERLKCLISGFHFRSGKSKEPLYNVALSGRYVNMPTSHIYLCSAIYGANWANVNLRRSIWIDYNSIYIPTTLFRTSGFFFQFIFALVGKSKNFLAQFLALRQWTTCTKGVLIHRLISILKVNFWRFKNKKRLTWTLTSYCTNHHVDNKLFWVV
jgi:hypothetical protein